MIKQAWKYPSNWGNSNIMAHEENTVQNVVDRHTYIERVIWAFYDLFIHVLGCFWNNQVSEGFLRYLAIIQLDLNIVNTSQNKHIFRITMRKDDKLRCLPSIFHLTKKKIIKCCNFKYSWRKHKTTFTYICIIRPYTMFIIMLVYEVQYSRPYFKQYLPNWQIMSSLLVKYHVSLGEPPR